MKKIIAFVLIGVFAAAAASAATLKSIEGKDYQKHVGKKITFVPKKVKSKNKGEGDTVSYEVQENGITFSSGTVTPPPNPPPKNPSFVNVVDLKPGTRTDVGLDPHKSPWLHITCPDKNPPKDPPKDAKPQPEPHLQIFGAPQGGTIEIDISEAEQTEIINFLKQNFK